MAGKSQRAAELLATLPQGVLVEFQEFFASLSGQRRDPDTGRYPPRPATAGYLLQLAEAIRLFTIRTAVDRELDVVASNSDGSPERRSFLLGLLGPGAREEIIDPGIEAITERLSVDGQLSADCVKARDRWYGKLVGERQEARRG